MHLQILAPRAGPAYLLIGMKFKNSNLERKQENLGMWRKNQGSKTTKKSVRSKFGKKKIMSNKDQLIWKELSFSLIDSNC